MDTVATAFFPVEAVAHVLLAIVGIVVYLLHLRHALGVPASSGAQPPQPHSSSRWRPFTPAFTRQTQKLGALAGMAMGSQWALPHLANTAALDLVLLVVQFIAQEAKGGAPVDDVALAVPLDLCFSFVLLGVAQGRIAQHFTWVVANLVMSFSVSTIPLVFGHKLPSGRSAGVAEPEVMPPPNVAPVFSRSSSNDTSTLNGHSTITDSSDFYSRRSSLHIPNHLTAAHLEVLAQGSNSHPCRSQCGSSTSSVVEQIQAGHMPRITAKPVHRLDHVTLPSPDSSDDPTSALIMRSSGMAIEMLDRHGRCMHYTSRVRRQRVYIKTGVAGIRDARLQELLPRVQSLLTAQSQQQQPSKPQVSAQAANSSSADNSKELPCITAAPPSSLAHSNGGAPPVASTVPSVPCSKGTLKTSMSDAGAGADQESAKSNGCVGGVAQASKPQGVVPTGLESMQQTTSVGQESCQPHLCNPSQTAEAPSQPLHRNASAQKELPTKHQQVSADLHSTPLPQQQGMQPKQMSAKHLQPHQQVGGISQLQQQQDSNASLQQQRQQGNPILQQRSQGIQQLVQQQQQSHILKPMQPQHSQSPSHQPQTLSRQYRRPVFGGVYVRDGCVEMTLDLLSFAPPALHSKPGKPSSEPALTADVPDAPCITLPDKHGWSDWEPGHWLHLMGLSHREQPPLLADPAPTHPGHLIQHGQLASSSNSEESSSNNSSRGTGVKAEASHHDPYFKLQLSEGEVIRTWCQHRRMRREAAKARLLQGAEPSAGTYRDACMLQQQTPEQWEWIDGAEKRQTVENSTQLCLDVPHLLSVYPSVAIASRNSHSSDVMAQQSTPSCAPACTRVHLYVLPSSSFIGSADSIAICARYQGRFLPTRLISHSLCPLVAEQAGPSGASGHVRGTGIVPATALLEVELGGDLSTGLVHFEVYAPVIDGPSASACMLVLGAHQANMAAELGQLQPSCETQARQEAVATARSVLLVQQGPSCRRGNVCCRCWDGSRNTSSRQYGGGDADGEERACPCFRSSAHKTQARVGAQALLHDVGVWLELEAAAVRVWESKGVGAEAMQHSLDEQQPTLAHPDCAAGSADLSAQFTEGLAYTQAAMVPEIMHLVAHLHATALLLGWHATAQHVAPCLPASLDNASTAGPACDRSKGSGTSAAVHACPRPCIEGATSLCSPSPFRQLARRAMCIFSSCLLPLDSTAAAIVSAYTAAMCLAHGNAPYHPLLPCQQPPSPHDMATAFAKAGGCGSAGLAAREQELLLSCMGLLVPQQQNLLGLWLHK